MTTLKKILITANIIQILIFAQSISVLFSCTTASSRQITNDQPPKHKVIGFRTENESINHKYHFLLSNNKIWYKQKHSNTWTLFDKTGLPKPYKHTQSGFVLPEKIISISTDGNNLIALSQSRQVYYTKLDKIKWQHTWGKPIAKPLFIPKDVRAWGISHRWGKQLAFYEDIAGKKHNMRAGVTTLYILTKDGSDILYTDPWLPPVFGHNVALPFQGRFIAVNMAVSGSTLFVINQTGEMYTRLYDFDTSGQNPFLKYTYNKKSKKDIRTLPAEDWYKQPQINGKITKTISILQTGKGNAARELRVEGKSASGQTGYFFKNIYAKTWSFQTTGHTIKSPFLKNNPNRSSLLSAPKTNNYTGILKRLLVKKDIKVKILQYSPYFPPAKIRFTYNKQHLDVPLYFRQIYKFSKQTKYRGMMILPHKSRTPGWFDPIHKNYFNQMQYIPLKITETKTNIIMKSNMKKTVRQCIISITKS